MSAIPTNPLTKPHLDKLAGLNDPGDVAGAEEIERRVQDIFNQWLKCYFGGNPFQTPAESGTVAKTFQQCEILWGRATPDKKGRFPILHTMLADRRDGAPVRIRQNLSKVVGDWTWNVFVRSHPQMPVSPADSGPAKDSAIIEADRICTRVGDQYAWLIRSAHAQELALKGIGRVAVASGPRPVQSGGWYLNQLVISARITFRIRNNAPG